VFIRTKVTSQFHRKVKKKFINKVNIQRFPYSIRLNEYINNTFLKFYKLYISAQQTMNSQLTEISYDLTRLMHKKVRRFAKRYIIKRRKVLKFFYRFLKKKKLRRYPK
jgi:hypothetical protein